MSGLKLSAAIAVALSLATGAAMAQPGSPACVRLENQLQQIEGGGGQAQQARLQQQFAQQRAELDRTTAQARSMGCGSRFLFGPAPPPQCRGLEQRMTQLRSNLDQIDGQLRRGRGGGGQNTAQRNGIVIALAENGCGQQYVAAARAQEQQRQQGGGLFGLLFGGRPQPQQGLPEGPAIIEPEQPRQRSGYRTVCVRTCDGFFFPVNYSTSPQNFGHDEDVCRRTCPGTEAKLFSYPTGGSIAQGMSTHGEAYKETANAFRYQKEFVKDCSCKPANISWAEALAGNDDSVKPGDIVVDEERSRQMAQPRGGNSGGGQSVTPAQAARAAQDAATAAPVDQVEETAPETLPPSELNLEAGGVYAPPR